MSIDQEKLIEIARECDAYFGSPNDWLKYNLVDEKDVILTREQLEQFAVRVIELETPRIRAEALRTYKTPRHIDEWHEDMGFALWWALPVCEPPYVGTPLDTDWPGYHTHWTPLICDLEAEHGAE